MNCNCPACGASVSSVVINCDYCGVEIAKASKSQITPKELINALQKAIASVPLPSGDGFWGSYQRLVSVKPTAEAQSKIIGGFPLPEDLDLLLAFFLHCHGNVPQGGGLMVAMAMSLPAIAWKSKCGAAYQSLRLKALNNPQISTFLAPFEAVYGNTPNVSQKSFLSRFLGM